MNVSADLLTTGIVGNQRRPSRGWSSRTAFILAAAGSAIGLGNIWKFPYIAGENGGGAFVLVYLACIAVIGLPILVAEILIGRRGQGSPVHCIESLAVRDGHSRRWTIVGWLGIACAFLILSFYSVVAGWSLSYLWFAIDGQLAAGDPSQVGTAEALSELFAGLLESPGVLIAGHTAVMAGTIAIVAGGIRNGLEKAVSIMVPALFGLLVVLVVYAAMTTGKFGEAAAFLFRPDFSSLSWGSVLVALGHAFFTLSVGMTAMMAYGSFLRRDVSVGHAAIAIAGLDTIVALLAGLAIFPIVFAQGLGTDSGPGLIFVTLPVAFAGLPGGMAAAILFFLFLAVAALSSTISILEPVVEYVEQRWDWKRRKSATTIGIAIWLLGFGPALAFNVGSDFKVFGLNLFDLFDWLTSHLLLPLGGLLISVYAGYALSRESLAAEFGVNRPRLFQIWRFLLRYLVPIGVATVLATNLF